MTAAKRLLAALGTVVLLLSFAACDNGKAPPVFSEPPEPPSSQTASSALPGSEGMSPDGGDAPEQPVESGDHVVYMTTEITPQGQENTFQAQGRIQN